MNKCSAAAQMGNSLATMDMGQKLGAVRGFQVCGHPVATFGFCFNRPSALALLRRKMAYEYHILSKYKSTSQITQEISRYV